MQQADPHCSLEKLTESFCIFTQIITNLPLHRDRKIKSSRGERKGSMNRTKEIRCKYILHTAAPSVTEERRDSKETTQIAKNRGANRHFGEMWASRGPKLVETKIGKWLTCC